VHRAEGRRSARRAYGHSPSFGGKYFGLTLQGVQAYSKNSWMADSVVTATTVPKSILEQGFLFNDPGLTGPLECTYGRHRHAAMLAITLAAARQAMLTPWQKCGRGRCRKSVRCRGLTDDALLIVTALTRDAPACLLSRHS
jgi:hypothetical protein